MKRSLTVFLIIITLVPMFSGCLKSQKQYVHKSFESDVFIETHDKRYEGKIIYTHNGDVNLNITYPETLSGTVVRFSNDEKTVSHNGISIALGEESPVGVICEILCDFSNKECKLKNKGSITVCGETNGTAYEILVDCEKMKILKIQTDTVVCTFA